MRLPRRMVMLVGPGILMGTVWMKGRGLWVYCSLRDLRRVAGWISFGVHLVVRNEGEERRRKAGVVVTRLRGFYDQQGRLLQASLLV